MQHQIPDGHSNETSDVSSGNPDDDFFLMCLILHAFNETWKPKRHDKQIICAILKCINKHQKDTQIRRQKSKVEIQT